MIDEIISKAHEVALQYFENKNMQRMIEKIISKVINFNKAYTAEDYRNQAYLALFKASLKYNIYHKSNINSSKVKKFLSYEADQFLDEEQEMLKSNMKFETYAYWYIQKELYELAGSGGDVFFLIEDDDGSLQELTAIEYYKNKKKFNGSAKSVKRVYNFSELTYDDGDDHVEFEPVDYEEYSKVRNNHFSY